MEKLCETILPNMPVYRSTAWKPGIYELYDQSGPVVTRSGIVLDLSGVVLRGGLPQGGAAEHSGEIHEEFSYGDDRDEAARVAALGYRGIALTLRGVQNVTVRGLTASGFDLAILVEDCENITIEGCNLSDNFHDVECGWNEHGPKGGILLLRSHHCTVRRNRANNVWNGVCLQYSHHNLVEQNDFSYCSNMCVKMWNACRNTIDGNNLSWGLRIKPGEVHARDSAGLLMESGCDHNIIRRNDITHGGDGIFIRVLNGWHSRFNLFEENDCSYANNNAIEAWSSSNTWLRNKANHSSYGFWMGGSDDTLMQENEAAYNGVSFKNAPESFGNAGVAVVNASGTRFRLIGNHIHHNAGPGLAVRHDRDYPVHHLLLEDNHIHDNRNVLGYKGDGAYFQNASWITMSNNRIHDNEGEALRLGDRAADVFQLEGGNDFLRVKTAFPERIVRVGEALRFSCETDLPADVRWDFGDGSYGSGSSVEKVYSLPGSYYAGVTASTRSRSEIDGRVLYLLPRGTELGIDRSYEDEGGCRHVMEAALPQPAALEGANRLFFLLHQISEADTDWDKTVKSPVVTLLQDEENKLVITPRKLTSDTLFFEKTWEKVFYRSYCLPLDESDGDFTVERIGNPVRVVSVRVEVIQKNAGRFRGRLRGFSLYRAEPQVVAGQNPARNAYPELFEYPRLIADHLDGRNPKAILGDNPFLSDATCRWVARDDRSFVGVELDREVRLDGVCVWLYESSGPSLNSTGECLPERLGVEGFSDGHWHPLAEAPVTGPGLLRISFSSTRCTALRLLPGKKGASIWRLALSGGDAPPRQAVAGPVAFHTLQCKVNVERNAEGDRPSDLLVFIHRAVDKKPVGEPLFTGVLSASEVRPGQVNSLSLDGLTLEEGEYAAVFTQRELAPGRTQGAYYRLPNREREDGERQGILSPGGCKDETGTWGCIWLRLVSQQGVLDLSHDGEATGVRAGFVGMEARYQTFTVAADVLRR